MSAARGTADPNAAQHPACRRPNTLRTRPSTPDRHSPAPVAPPHALDLQAPSRTAAHRGRCSSKERCRWQGGPIRAQYIAAPYLKSLRGPPPRAAPPPAFRTARAARHRPAPPAPANKQRQRWAFSQWAGMRMTQQRRLTRQRASQACAVMPGGRRGRRARQARRTSRCSSAFGQVDGINGRGGQLGKHTRLVKPGKK